MGAGLLHPSGTLFGLPNTSSDMWVLPQPMEGDKGSGGQGLAVAPPGTTQPQPPQPPSTLAALGGPNPHWSPAGKGEGAGGRARRTKKSLY